VLNIPANDKLSRCEGSYDWKLLLRDGTRQLTCHLPEHILSTAVVAFFPYLGVKHNKTPLFFWKSREVKS